MFCPTATFTLASHYLTSMIAEMCARVLVPSCSELLHRMYSELQGVTTLSTRP